MTVTRHLRALAEDAALASLVIGAGLVQWATRNFSELGPTPDAGELATAPDLLGLLLVVLAGLPLLLRRRYPLAVLAASGAASIVALALRYGITVHLGPAVALFTIAQRDGPTRRRWGMAGGAVAFVAVAALEWERLDARGDFGIDAILWAGAWAAGAQRRLAAHRRAERREHEIAAAAAAERARIARELHDSAGHAITTILAHAGVARVMRRRDPEAADAAVLTVESLARETLEDIDRLVGALREDDETAERAPAPGLDDVPRLVEQHRGAGLDVTLQQDGVVASTLPAPVDRAAYRIVQEALTNAARHGTGADTVVAIRARPDALQLEITNPVTARRPPRAGGGRGLHGMRERVALLDGTLSAGVEGERFVLTATLPLRRAEDGHDG